MARKHAKKKRSYGYYEEFNEEQSQRGAKASKQKVMDEKLKKKIHDIVWHMYDEEQSDDS